MINIHNLIYISCNANDAVAQCAMKSRCFDVQYSDIKCFISYFTSAANSTVMLGRVSIQ